MLWATNNFPPSGGTTAIIAQQIIDSSGSDLFILDVREEYEFERGRIKEAINIPLDAVAESLEQVPTDRPVLIICRTGSRAEEAWGILTSARPAQKNIWYLRGTPRYAEDGTYKFY